MGVYYCIECCEFLDDDEHVGEERYSDIGWTLICPSCAETSNLPKDKPNEKPSKEVHGSDPEAHY